MKNGLRIWSAVISAVLILSGCGVSEEDEPQYMPSQNIAEESDKVEEPDPEQVMLNEIEHSAYRNVDGLNLEPGTYISVIGKSAEGEYWEAIERGAIAAEDAINERLGYKGDDKVKVVYSGPEEEENVDEQVNILDEELARYPSALAIALVDTQSCDVQFDLATENSIPIVTFDSSSDYHGIMAKVSTDNEKAAKEAAIRTAEELGEQGTILVFSHDFDTETAMLRTDAFVKEIKMNHGRITIANTYYLDCLDEFKIRIAEEIKSGLYHPEWSKQVEYADGNEIDTESITDEQVLDYILERNPTATAIYATNGTAVAEAVALAERMGREDMVITGFDTHGEALEALKDGRVAGLVKQNPYGMGYAAVIAAARSVLELGNEAQIDIGYRWVTHEEALTEEITY